MPALRESASAAHEVAFERDGLNVVGVCFSSSKPSALFGESGAGTRSHGTVLAARVGDATAALTSVSFCVYPISSRVFAPIRVRPRPAQSASRTKRLGLGGTGPFGFTEPFRRVSERVVHSKRGPTTLAAGRAMGFFPEVPGLGWAPQR